MDKYGYENINEGSLLELTRGHEADSHWVMTEDGNWTPSIWDRRRLVSATMNYIIETHGGMPIATIPSIIASNSVDDYDAQHLAEKISDWLKKNRAI